MAKSRPDPQTVIDDLKKLVEELKKHGSDKAEIRKEADQQASAESLLLGIKHKLRDLSTNPGFGDTIKSIQAEANRYGAKAYLQEIEKHFLDIDNNVGNSHSSLKYIIDKKKIVDELQKAGGGKYLDKQEQKYLGAVEKRWEEQKAVVDLKYAYDLFQDLSTGRVDPDKTLAEIKAVLKKRGADARALNAEGKMPVKDRDSNIDDETLSAAKKSLEEAYHKGNFKKAKLLLEDLKDGLSDPKELLPEINSRFAKANLPKNLAQSLEEEIKTNTAIGYINRAARGLKTLEEDGGFEKLPQIKEALSGANNAKANLNEEDADRLNSLNNAYAEQKKMHDALEKFHNAPKGKSEHLQMPPNKRPKQLER